MLNVCFCSVYIGSLYFSFHLGSTLLNNHNSGQHDDNTYQRKLVYLTGLWASCFSGWCWDPISISALHWLSIEQKKNILHFYFIFSLQNLISININHTSIYLHPLHIQKHWTTLYFVVALTLTCEIQPPTTRSQYAPTSPPPPRTAWFEMSGRCRFRVWRPNWSFWSQFLTQITNVSELSIGSPMSLVVSLM